MPLFIIGALVGGGGVMFLGDGLKDLNQTGKIALAAGALFIAAKAAKVI